MTWRRQSLSLLKSNDIFEWKFASSALLHLNIVNLGNNFRVPGVACFEGKCYLYYSVGQGDKNHQMHVAVSETPQGPYHDTG